MPPAGQPSGGGLSAGVKVRACEDSYADLGSTLERRWGVPLWFRRYRDQKVSGATSAKIPGAGMPR
jgi:hypothetical protein